MNEKNLMKNLLTEQEFSTLAKRVSRTKFSIVPRDLYWKLVSKSGMLMLYTDIKPKLSDNQLHDAYDFFNSTRPTREEIKPRTIHLKNLLLDYVEMVHEFGGTHNYKMVT